MKLLSTADYQKIIERVSDGFIAFDKELRYVFVNDSACVFLRRNKEELIGNHLLDVFPESLQLPFIQKYHEAIRTGITMQWEEYLPPYKRWFFNVIYPSENGLSVFFKDITERKKYEDDLLIANERFKLAALATNDVVWDWDLKTNHIWWNNNFKELFLYKSEEIESTIVSWERRIHSADHDRIVEGIYKSIANGDKTWSDEYRFLRGDGTYATLYDRGYIVRDEAGTPVRMIGAMMDISARKKAETDLKNLNQQLRLLSSRIQNVVEEERKRIAHEIHDELGQQLTLIKLEIASTKKEFPNLSQAGTSKVESVLFSVNHVIKSLQRIASDLRPQMLDDLGLIATLDWYCASFEKRTGIKCRCEIDFDDNDVSRESSIGIFRIFQETFTNIARHSGATEVHVKAREEKECLTLTITDNGNGFNPKEKKFLNSLGLLGMRERATTIGAELIITSAENKGTRIKVVVPRKHTLTHT